MSRRRSTREEDVMEEVREAIREFVATVMQAEKEAAGEGQTLYESVRQKLISIFGATIPKTPSGRFQWERVIMVILRELGGCATLDEMLFVLGIDRSDVRLYRNLRRALVYMARKGIVARTARGFYCIPGREPRARLEAVQA